MNLSEVKETYSIFNSKLGSTYGEMGKQDFLGFINYLIHDEELKKNGWELGEALPFDLETLIDEYIEQDEIYKPFH